MAYNTTGRSHREGIKNEKNIKELLTYLKNDLNEPTINEAFSLDENKKYEFVLKGGTKEKSDLNIVDKNNVKFTEVSIKKRNLGSTFDLINTSKIEEYFENDVVVSKYKPLKEYILSVKGVHRNKYYSELEKETIVKNIKINLNKHISNFIKSLGDAELKSIIYELSKKDCAHLLICTFEPKASADEGLISLNSINKENRYDYLSLLDSKSKLSFDKNSRGDASGSILVNGVKSCLRLRVALNNGVTALTGLNWENKKKNQHSSLTFKIQVDSPDELIEKSKDVVSIKFDNF